LLYKDKFLHSIGRIFVSPDTKGCSVPENKPKLLEYPYDEIKRQEDDKDVTVSKKSDSGSAVIQEFDPYIENLTKKLNTSE